MIKVLGMLAKSNAGNPRKFLLILFCILYTSACLRTELKPSAILQPVIKLTASNQKAIHFQISESDQTQSLGHQYLFFFIPFGTVYHPTLEQALADQTYTKLALGGFRPTLDKGEQRYSNLIMTLKNVQVSAFDFLFFRKIVCNLELQGTLSDVNGVIKRSWTAGASNHEYKALAFQPQLQHTFGLCLQSAVDQVLSNIGLINKVA